MEDNYIVVCDFSQISYGHIAMELARSKNNTIDPDYIRHMILNQIRSLNVRFRKQYGQMYMIYDSGSWRSRIFEHYKGSRKKSREKSLVDWDAIHKIVTDIQEGIREYLPMPVIKAQGAEADDIIGYLSAHVGQNQDVLIISTDKDFKQLQYFSGVKQWSPTMDSFLVEKNPLAFLKEMLILGDKGDGIPNYLSDLDTFMTDKKQKIMSTKRKDEARQLYDITVEPFAQFPSLVSSASEDVTARLKLNWQLMSLVDPNIIPVDVRQNIRAAIAEAKPKNPDVFFWLSSIGCKQLATKTADFFVKA